MIPIPQQGGNQAGNHSLSTHDSQTFSNPMSITTNSSSTTSFGSFGPDGGGDDDGSDDMGGGGSHQSVISTATYHDQDVSQFFGVPEGLGGSVSGGERESLGSHHTAASNASLGSHHSKASSQSLRIATNPPSVASDPVHRKFRSGPYSLDVPPTPLSFRHAVREMFPFHLDSGMLMPTMEQMMARIKEKYPKSPVF